MRIKIINRINRLQNQYNYNFKILISFKNNNKNMKKVDTKIIIAKLKISIVISQNWMNYR